jgi:glycosyltransferase involved in cell wall biosynthesis
MTRLSLVMIVRDEARCLARCLDSVRPHVDGMIVVDTGSVDETVEIAASRGAAVHRFAWCDDFAAARNAALDRSDADWNLVLDADEWIEGDADALGPGTLPPAAAAPARFIGCVGIVNQGRPEGGVARKSIPRLLPRGVRYEGRVHEQPVSPLPLVALRLRIGHDGYDEAQLSRKGDRNEALLRSAIEAAPDDSYLWYQLGKEQMVRGRPAEAAEHLMTAYRASDPDLAFRHGIVVRTIQALKRAERFADALALVDAEQTNWPESPDFYFAVADLYLDWAGRNPAIAFDQLLPVVESAWKRCLAIGERPDLDGSIEGCGSYLAADNLAMFYQTLGIEDEARLYAQSAAEMRRLACT